MKRYLSATMAKILMFSAFIEGQTPVVLPFPNAISDTKNGETRSFVVSLDSSSQFCYLA